jgi:arabinofuranan 3-O-arabinosyltransferase
MNRAGTSHETLVSIIIPTYNAGRVLGACLESIERQSHRQVEVVVVDQESTDGTAEIARAAGASVITLPPPDFYSPPSRSRNAGAAAARGEILYHLDSDMRLTPSLLGEAVARFHEEPDCGALIVPEHDIATGYWARCKALERRCYRGNDAIESARIVRRAVFQAVGGYDERISSGEDFDIHRRYKAVARVGWCRQVVEHDLGRLTLGRTIAKKFEYGKTASAYFVKHQSSGGSLLRAQIACYATNYRLFLRSPLVGAGAIALKLAEFGAGGLGALAARWRPPAPR